MNYINSNKKDLSPEQRDELLSELKVRFEKNMNAKNLNFVRNRISKCERLAAQISTRQS